MTDQIDQPRTNNMADFQTNLQKMVLEKLPKDDYGGTRYQVRFDDKGRKLKLRIPGCFLKISKIHHEEMYLFAYPEKPEDSDFLKMRKNIDDLMEKIKEEVGEEAKEYTPLVKEDRSYGIILKPYFRYDNGKKKISSKFFASDGKLMVPETDERLNSERYEKSMYPVIDVDSVYLTREGKASVQLKLAECAVYATEIQSILDLDMINKMRAMKLKEAKA